MKLFVFFESVLFFVSFFLVSRYNIHMFQLNSYKKKEHLLWIKKNIAKQSLLLFTFLVSVILLCLQLTALNDWTKSELTYFLLCSLLFIVLIIVYIYKEQKASKKKLVYTPRVKRLLFANFLLCILIFLPLLLTFNITTFYGLLLAIVSLEPLILLISALVVTPIETGINNHYINDAKKMLASVPGLTVIGITGSYGKTSVKFFLNTLLSEKFNVLMTPESYNTPMGIVRTVREGLRPTHEIFLCEMGARHVGDIKEVCDIAHPIHGIITSIGPQHLETFYNLDNIKNTKFELADAVSGKGYLFLNGDNEYVRERSTAYDKKIFYYGHGETDGYFASEIVVSGKGTEFSVTAPSGENDRFSTKLVGEHNVINLVGAICVAHTLGVPFGTLKIALRRIKPVPHRLELKKHGNITIIDDAYNSNPIGSKAAVETLALFDGVRILITPGMVELGDKENEYNHKFGTYAATCCDYILLVGKKHTNPIKQGAIESGFNSSNLKSFDILEDALNYAYTIKDVRDKFILLENDLPDNY